MNRRLILAQLGAIALPHDAWAQPSVEQTGRLQARPLQNGTPVLAAPPRGYSLLGINKTNRSRDAVLYAPAAFDPLKPIPLLVFLHGAGQNGAFMVKMLRNAAESHCFLLLAPTSQALTWDMHHAPACADSVTIDAALAQVFASATADRRRIALGGMSDGASFALSLGLANGDLFSDVLSFSAGFFHVPLRFGRPRLFISHGRSDQIIAFRTGREIAERLRGAAYDLRFEPFGGGHAIPETGLEIALTRFLGG